MMNTESRGQRINPKQYALIWAGILLVLSAALAVGLKYIAPSRAAQPAAATSARVAAAPAVQAPLAVQPTIQVPAVDKAGSSNLLVPAEIGGLKRSDLVTGVQALKEINQLHGKDFALLDGYMAHYIGGQNKADLWVAQARDVNEAAQMVELMTAKIGEGRSPFKELKSVDVGKVKLYTAEGLGQMHYYYQINDKVIWLAVDADKAADALHQVFRGIQ